MKLNHECVRDLLLTIEEEVPFNGLLRLDRLEQFSTLSNYSHEEILYCLSKLHEAKFIHAKEIRFLEGLKDIYVQELTWDGHAFLDNIRDPKVWKKVKEKASFLKSVSISMLGELGSNVVKKSLGLE